MIAIKDHGHEYLLFTLDQTPNCDPQKLVFVKREGKKFPGNHGSHPGTTIQSVLRVLHSRVSFLQSQDPCKENEDIMFHIRSANLLLEQRAARRHGLTYTGDQFFAISTPMCDKCGHTLCEHLKGGVKSLIADITNRA